MKHATHLLICLLWGIILFPIAVLGEIPPVPVKGYKFFKNYPPEECFSHPQNWSIEQNLQGLLYVANQEDLLEFDGITWRHLPIPNQSARSIAINESGTLFIGGVNELGFLQPGNNGTSRYMSLLPYLPTHCRDFGTVWKTLTLKEDVYFYTSDYLFRWEPKQKTMFFWRPTPQLRFNTAFACNGKLYIHERNSGLKTLQNNALIPVPGQETFANEKIYMMATYDSRNILIGTRDHGFFLWDGNQAKPFPTEADTYLKNNELYHGIRLRFSPGDYALATRLGGLVIIDAHGRLKHIFNKEYGILDNSVKHVFEDFQGNLWLAQNIGISKIEYPSPISIYDQRAGLSGLVLSVQKHGNTLYAGTYNGLFYLNTSTNPGTGTFTPVPNMSSTCWSILSTRDVLLIATIHGVFRIDPGKNSASQDNLPTIPTFVLLPSRVHPGRIWVGSGRGLISLSSPPQWREEFTFPTITQEIRTMEEDHAGNLWLGLRSKDVLKVSFIENADPTIAPIPQITRFDTHSGLPAGEIQVFTMNNHIVLATESGLFQPEEKTKRFIPDTTLGPIFTGGALGRGIFRLTQDQHRHIWFHSLAQNFHAIPLPDGTFQLEVKPFLRIPAIQVNQVFPDQANHTIWFAGLMGLIAYDTRVTKLYAQDFATVIREVWVQGKTLSIPDTNYDNIKNDNDTPIIPYHQRNLRFRFAAPFFEDENDTMYQWLLEGYENEWSTWSKETQKDYTNLNHGNGVFRVRARNIYGDISQEAVFRFRVLPPWYKTWWAFLFYIAVAFLLVFWVVRWRSSHLELEKQKLEAIIQQRTTEIKDKNQQLEVQAEQLKELSLAKSTFFANISHEFRTPLTLLFGPLEQMLAECPENATAKKQLLTMMLRNTQRLLRLINQLLELSRLDSGKMKLQARLTPIVPFLRGIVSSFQLLAQQSELALNFQVPVQDDIEAIHIYIDATKMEDIMSNLLINAIKFTPAGGKVTVAVQLAVESIEISVTDTGSGIPEEQLSHVFKRFYQVKNGSHIYRGGAGIGLALVRELVELHHGSIHVSSSEHVGTTFTFLLPCGRAHLNDAEIIYLDNGPSDQRPYKIPREFQPLPWQTTGSETEEPAQTSLDLDEVETSAKEIILIVEDNTDVRQYIKGSLEGDYTIVEASDGREGIDKAREYIPDLIISDIMMPEVDGHELCRTLKNEVATSHIPIILLTAKASEQSIVEGLQTGADDYVIKPFNTTILLARIKNLIQLRHHLQLTMNREMTLQPVKIDVSPIDKEFIKDLKKVIEDNLSDPDFNVEQLCKKLYMSRPTVYRKIQALSGESPTDFIRSYRLKRAAELLKSNFGSILEVALEVGFSSATYFTKCFKKKFQQLPSDY